MATLAEFPRIICRVKALYSFASSEQTSLCFEKDDLIDVLTQLDTGWWDGWCNGNRGWFPSNYVEVVEVNPDIIEAVQRDQIVMSKIKRFSHKKMPLLPAHPRPGGSNDSEDDSEEEARTINLIRNMNIPSEISSTTVTRNHSLSFQNKDTSSPNQKHIKDSNNTPYTHPHSQLLLHRHNQERQSVDEERKLVLPEGWVVRVADDGVTKFYFNQKTGGVRWNHPSVVDSEDENYDSSGDEYDTPLTNNSASQSSRSMENLDDYDDFGKKTKDSNRSSSVLTEDEPPNLMQYWIKRTTPQGKVYYGNSVTHETTWDYEDIDLSTGRLKNKNLDDEESNEPEREKTKEPETPLAKKEQPLTWKSIATQIAQSVQDLNNALSESGETEVLRVKIINVVDTVRHVLYASRSMDKEAPHLQDGEIKETLRVVLSTLAKLILTAKVLKNSNAEVSSKTQRDASDVLNAVRKFVLICQSKDVQVEQVNPRFIVLERDSDADDAKNRRKSSTPSALAAQKLKIPLNQDLLVSLQTHANQIKGSTDALCQASSYIYSLEQKEEEDTSGEGESSRISNQRARSNVILLFQNLSPQVGNYLAILNGVDITQIENFQVKSLPRFLCNKQKLYNAVGLLFSAVQCITDPEGDISDTLNNVQTAVEKVGTVLEELSSTVAEMVSERKVWLIKNGKNTGANIPADWSSPTNPYFDAESKKSNTTKNKVLDDASDMESPEELSPLFASRFYNRQNSTHSQLSSQHRPSISTSTTSGSSLSRPIESTPLKRQYSFGQGTNVPEDRSQYWFLGYDYDEGDIEFTQEKTIKGGTLRALVERLTLHDYMDMSYIANFLLTYRSFCTTEQFVELLQERYNLVPPEGLTPDELDIWTEKKQKLVRLRVYNIMKNWLENYYNDEDEFILDKLELFANTVICDSSSFSADQLNKLIRKRRELDDDGGGLKRLIPNIPSGPTPILPKNIHQIRTLEIDFTELARQLTIMDYRLYSSIRPIECLGKAWSNDGAENATNVKQSIDYCNRLTAWVTGCILAHREAKKRVTVIKYWSQVANKCIEMNNYNTCMAILSAFDNSAIGRLKKTWELVSSRTTQSLAQIRKLMGSNRNFTEYREMIHSVNPPCIPFLGIYLQDLTFIADGNPDFLKTSTNLINFAKQQKSAEVIREIKQFQSPGYNLQDVPEIQEFIKKQLEDIKDIDFLYERSLEIEPRISANNDTVT